jgi:NAD-dependent DNA ligase
MANKPTIAGNTFMFTGTLTHLKRAEAEGIVKDNGGTILSGVTAKLNILVVGEDAGSKLEKAKKLGTVKILTEKEFMKMVPANAVVAAPKTKAVKVAAPKAKAVKVAAPKAKSAKAAPKKAPAVKEVKPTPAKAAKPAKTNGIAGKSFYFLDIFTMKNLSTREGEDIVEDNGGIVAESIDRNLDYLVHNTRRSDMSALMVTRLMEAQELGVKVINEAQLLKLAS